MSQLPDELRRRIDEIAGNREAGAADILELVIALLRDVLGRGQTPGLTRGPTPPDLVTVAAALCRAQPSMAPVWNAAIEAVASETDPGRFERFTQRVSRASDAMVRFALDSLTATDDDSAPLSIVTISASRSVQRVLEALAATRTLRVACAEGRPALEGRRLSAALAARGISVTCYSDAAIGHALTPGAVVLVGADAVAPAWFLNKSGTRLLASAATAQGLTMYVVATRDKFVGEAVAARLVIREGRPEEIWDAPPPGVSVANPYFERTPLDIVTGIISDAGVLGSDMVPAVCAAATDAAALRALEEIGRRIAERVP